MRSFEPGEDWYGCYVDDVAFELDVPPGPQPLLTRLVTDDGVAVA